MLWPRARGSRLLQGDFISVVTEPGAWTVIPSELVISANPSSGTEIWEEILQEASGAELGAQHWEQSSSHVCPELQDRITPGNPAATENLKLLNFTKHLDPVGLRNCDGGKDIPIEQP